VLAIPYVIISGLGNITFNRGAINRSATQFPSLNTLNTFSMFRKESIKLGKKQGLVKRFSLIGEKVQLDNG